jgi:hypothetical protein
MSSINNPQLNELNDLLSFIYDKQISHIINPYEGWNYISKLMYLYILSKYNNDCIIVSKNNAIDLTLYLDIKDKSVVKVIYPANDGIEYFNKIENCKNNGLKLVALPFSIRFMKNKKMVDDGHHNMIIFNLITMEVYRFEPHGYQYMLDEEYNSIDNQLRHDFENIGGFKYNSAKVVCPKKGFQAIETEIEYGLNEVGYCAAWSYFFLDLVFTYENMHISDIMNKALEIFKNDPNTIRNFIRSYVKFIRIEIDNIVEIIFDINDPYDNPTKIKKILNDIHMNKWGSGITKLYTDKIANYINNRLIEQAAKKSIKSPKKLLKETSIIFDIKSVKPTKELLKETPSMYDIKSFKSTKELLKETPTMFDIKSFKSSKELLKETPSLFDIKSFKSAKELLKETPTIFNIKSFKPAKELLKGGKRKSIKTNKRKSSRKK